MSPRIAPLPRFLLLYALLYAAFGVASPFLPALFASHGLAPEALGLVLAASTAVRLASGPLAGRLADRRQVPKAVLIGCTAAAALITFGYLPATGLLPLLLVSVASAAVLAPLTPISDALTLASAEPPAGASRRSFEYGWVRAAGSAAFILGALLAGRGIGRFGPEIIIWFNAAFLAAAALAATSVPDRLRAAQATPVALAFASRQRRTDIRALLELALFRRMLLIAGLVQGSHAFHDSFVVIHWRTIGIAPGTISLLWSEQVIAEVAVFLLIGPPLLRRLGPAGASALAGAAGVLRWAVLAQTTSIVAPALVEPLHGFTFALQHLACMALIAQAVPHRLAATAQALYGTVAIGAASALLALASGPLYAHFGAGGFWVMSALCATAVPLSLGLRTARAPCATRLAAGTAKDPIARE